MIFQFLSSLYLALTQFLSPPACLYCHENIPTRQAFCTSCSSLILPIVPFDFYVGKNTTITVFALSAYKDPVRSLILAKHRGNETSIHFLADLMCQQTVLQQLDIDIIIFIPLHWTRYAARGFNQAEIIARAVGTKMGKIVIPLIIRSKKTDYQARLSLQEREHNVGNAFALDHSYIGMIAGKNILIIDDLFTTGSTVKAVAALLIPYQPAKIQVLVACRVTGT